MNLVIVESPAKAKTIKKYLGSNYIVLPSYGHIRDLPAKDGSVLPDQDFKMTWAVTPSAAKRLKELIKIVKQSEQLILATDPDREGEAISWHILDILHKKGILLGKKIQRVVFNAITKNAVLEAMANPRSIDQHLVNAYLARRALDYLVGFGLSPVLWRKLPGSRSAGRVQSVALRLICDRETEIESFVPRNYWSVEASLATPSGDIFSAYLIHFAGKKIERLTINNLEMATNISNMLNRAIFCIKSIRSSSVKRNPCPPFTTSTLQQVAASLLGFSALRTMQIAQRLYEGVEFGGESTGLITYMRTDGVQMAPEAISDARTAVAENFGNDYVPKKPTIYSTRVKNAQEAHEAIRPVDFRNTPDKMYNFLENDQWKLYDLIWKRAVASQMRSAEIDRQTVEILAHDGKEKTGLRATGSIIRFRGFLTLTGDKNKEDIKLPEMHENEELQISKINILQHKTEPKPRYLESSLIKKLEALGIGRPSTYVSTLVTLQDRNYISITNRSLIPEAKGRIVTAFLASFFRRYVAYDFTASLEEKLDLISDGKLEWKEVLYNFWKDFTNNIENIKGLRISNVLDILNNLLSEIIFPAREDNKDPQSCPSCNAGRLSLKLSRFGVFVGCSKYPECNYVRKFDQKRNYEGMVQNEVVILGYCANTGEEITSRTGRFGPYVQLGKRKEAKRARIPKEWRKFPITFEKAIALLALPREVGRHPDSGTPIFASIGRFGPYVVHEKLYVNINDINDVFNIDLNEAVTLLARKQKKSKNCTSIADLTSKET